MESTASDAAPSPATAVSIGTLQQMLQKCQDNLMSLHSDGDKILGNMMAIDVKIDELSKEKDEQHKKYVENFNKTKEEQDNLFRLYDAVAEMSASL